MANFHLPPMGFGPGSQTDDADGAPQYMPMPQDMRVYAPHLPEVEDSSAYSPALALLEAIATACDTVAAGGAQVGFDLGDLDTQNRSLMAETLGQGEVSVKLRGVPAIAIQESVFAGVWVLSGHGIDRIEVAAIPEIVTKRGFEVTRPAQGTDTPRNPQVLNAPPLYVELKDKSGAYSQQAELHVVNLSLLPHSEEDLVWLDAALGQGAATILSRGYGNCRVTATALPHVWRVQYFNSMDTLILDTFEVTDLPDVVLAASEDLEDSSKRLRQVLEAIR